MITFSEKVFCVHISKRRENDSGERMIQSIFSKSWTCLGIFERDLWEFSVNYFVSHE